MIRMLNILCLGLVSLMPALSPYNALAQQDPLYSQYLNNPLVINPAYAGITNNLNTSLSYRKQWAGLDGSPTTVNASGHISLGENRMGAGIMLVQDKLGSNSTTEFHGIYSYRISLNNKIKLSFGLQTGISNYKNDFNDLNLQSQNDPAFQGNENRSKLSIGTGALLISDRFMIGLSVPRMLKATNRIDTLTTSLYNQHFYATAAYLFFLTERIRFKPSVLLKSVKAAPLSVDLNASLIFLEKYTGGLFTRNFNTYGLLVQYQINEVLRVGYVLEVPSGPSVGSNFTTHEITIGFRTAVLNFHDKGTIKSF